MNIRDISIVKWSALDTRDSSEYEKLPTMYTVMYKGTPIADTANPDEWIKENISVAANRGTEK